MLADPCAMIVESRVAAWTSYDGMYVLALVVRPPGALSVMQSVLIILFSVLSDN